MKRFIVLAAAIATLTLLPALARGDLSAQQVVHVDFEAVITWVDDPFSYAPPTWELGDTVMGFYEYELGAEDLSSDPSRGDYRYSTPPSRIWVSHEGYVFMTDTARVDLRLAVANDVPLNGHLWDALDVHSLWNLLEPEVLGIGAGPIVLDQADSTGTVFESDSLPEYTPNAAWTHRKRLQILGEESYWIRADLISCVMGTPTGIAQTPPPSLSLLRNYPNPFSSSTIIEYELQDPSTVVLTIYNVRGQRVANMVLPAQGVGRQTVVWNGLDDNGRKVASGVYLYRVEAGGFSQTKKMIILR